MEVTTDKVKSPVNMLSARLAILPQNRQMVGLNIPVIPVEHQYIVTEAHPDIKARQAEGHRKWVCFATLMANGICVRSWRFDFGAL